MDAGDGPVSQGGAVMDYQPCPMPVDTMLRPDTFDSMAVDDDSPWTTCASCTRLRVEREGDICKLCAFFRTTPTPSPEEAAA